MADRASNPAPAGPGSELGLYVHVPFCVKKCYYCDFASGPTSQKTREVHLPALAQEIRRSPWAGAVGRTLFFGGGTPSELSIAELTDLIAALEETFDFATDAERTIECNPGTVTPGSLAAMRDLGFNRISLGVQSFHDRYLQSLGRIHTAAEARQAYEWTGAAGFDNVNMDLIFALPDQTLAEWESDLQEVIGLKPTHLSLYQLTLEPGTEFGRRLAVGELQEADEDLSADMYERAMDFTAAAGYEQYEISNFAQPGRECAHNLIYWRNEAYLGFGLSAASYVAGRRWSNTRNLDEYARGALSGAVPLATDEQLSSREALGEEIMLRLRTRYGMSLDGLSRRYQIDVRQMFAEPLEFLTAQELVRHDGDRVSLTRRGRLLANAVCAEFLGG